MSLVFDEQRCTGCGICVADCVCGILALRDGLPGFKEGKSALCVHCGHCVAVCPACAATLDGMDPDALPSAEVTGLERHLDAFLKGRRAIRQYTGPAPDRALLERALGCAAYAPTAHNFRDVAYIIIHGRGQVEKILEHTVRHMERHGMYPGHVANVRKGNDTLFRGAPCLILIHAPERLLSETDCATAAAYLELALHGLGIGSCWAGMLIESCTHGLPEGIRLPEGRKLYGALMAGRPTVGYKRIPFRTKPEVIWE